MLYAVTVVVNFLALAVAVWLGIYIIAQSPRSAIAWLAGCTLWSVSGLFLNVLLALNPPPSPALLPLWLRPLLWFWPPGVFEHGWGIWLQGWQITPAVMIWHHLTTILRPGHLTAWRVIRIVSGYVLALAAAIGQRYTSLVFTSTSGDPLYLNTLVPGPLYPFYLVTLCAFASFSLINLSRSVAAASTPLQATQLRLMAIATFIAVLASVTAVLSYQTIVRLPRVTLSALLAVAIFLVGYAFARYSALTQGRVLGRDFLYNGFAVLVVAGLYLLVVWGSVMAYRVPIAALAIVVIVAIATHSLVDMGRRAFDVIFYRRDTRRLRAGLRDLVHKVQVPEAFDESLATALKILCNLVRATYGLILLVKEKKPYQASGYRWSGPPVQLRLEELGFDDVARLKPGRFPPPLDDAALAVPLYGGELQNGVLILGRPENALSYSDRDIEELLDPADRIAEAVRDSQLESERLAYLTQLVHAEPVTWELQGALPVKAVENAFRNLYDYACLADGPLAALPQVQELLPAGRSTHLDRGKCVYQALLDALERLRPPGDLPKEPIPRTWYPYLILRYAYIENHANNEIMARLYISEGTFNRARRMALRSIARALIEMGN